MFKQRILQNFEAERAAQKKMDEAQEKVGGLARTYALARAHTHACMHARAHTHKQVEEEKRSVADRRRNKGLAREASEDSARSAPTLRDQDDHKP